jgi:hypothetical protein
MAEATLTGGAGAAAATPLDSARPQPFRVSNRIESIAAIPILGREIIDDIRWFLLLAGTRVPE